MSALTGTGRLLRLALRRDRILLPSWLVAIGVVVGASIASVADLSATQAERAAAAAFAASNPVARAFNGPASGSELGALVLTETFLIVAILTSLLAAHTVIRHSRADEEAGRAELVGSAVVGRHARLVAAGAVGCLAAVLTGAVFSALLLAQGLAVPGSVLAGAAVAGVGSVFAALAAVAAQLFSTARGANLATSATIGIAFLLRAVGDTAGEVAEDGVTLISAWPTWLSPIGWAQQIRAFQDDAAILLLLHLGAVCLLSALALVLSSRRDVGAGLLPARRGPATAARTLRTPLGLAWRLQRGILAAWIVGLAVVGGSFGAIGDGVDELVATNPQLAEVLAAIAPDGSVTALFFSFVMGLLGIAAAGYAVQGVLRLRVEEAGGRLEPLLAAPVSRSRWVASHLAVTAAGTTVLLAVAGGSMATAYAAASGGGGVAAAEIVRGALVQVPAALTIGAAVTAVFALAPRWAAPVGWSLVAGSFVIGQLGSALQLPQAVLNLSPFTHVPAVPAVTADPLPLLLLGAVTSGLALTGWLAFRRRDLVTVV